MDLNLRLWLFFTQRPEKWISRLLLKFESIKSQGNVALNFWQTNLYVTLNFRETQIIIVWAQRISQRLLRNLFRKTLTDLSHRRFGFGLICEPIRIRCFHILHWVYTTARRAFQVLVIDCRMQIGTKMGTLNNLVDGVMLLGCVISWPIFLFRWGLILFLRELLI